MSEQPVPCVIYEPNGVPLTRGLCRLERGAGACARISDLDSPGRLVQRCLLGPIQSVWLHLRDGSLLSARIEDISFDAARGRSCALLLTPPVARPLPRAGERDRSSSRSGLKAAG